MTENDLDEFITFNGINGDSGSYLTEPMPVNVLVDLVRHKHWNRDHLSDLRGRNLGGDISFRVMPQYGDGSEPRKVGWGMIFPAGADPAQVDKILEAMDELVQLRREQTGDRFKVYRGAQGFRWVDGKPESKNDFLVRQGASVGPANPDTVPFYLLIVADPQSIPFSFQYELDVQYAVGRIYFHTLDEYARYARSVAAAEKGEVSLERRAVFFGVANPDDKATLLSAEHLVKPLYQFTDQVSNEYQLGWSAELVEPQDADRQTLKSLLGGSQTPAFLFTASHGMAWPYQHELQRKYQGALVCQDWRGPQVEKVNRQHFLAADDLPDDHNPLGTMVFSFACFGAGTPYWDEFAIAKNQDRSALAARPFLASLPTRLLGHPSGGALAVIGHIERAWTYSFQWAQLKSQTQAFQSVLYQLMNGKPVGLAMDDMNLRYAEIATMLNADLQEIKYNPQAVEPYKLAFEWTANNDARSYAILGDPAARMPVMSAEEADSIRPTIRLASRSPGILPVVLAQEALAALSQPEQQAIVAENQQFEKRLSVEGKIAGEESGAGREDLAGSLESEPEQEAPGTVTSSSPQEAAPRQEIVREQKLEQQPGDQPQEFVSPMDGLAFALQTYASDEAVAYGLTDDAKEKIREIVVNLNTALSNLAQKMQEITSEAAVLEVTTGVVDDLKDLDDAKVDQRFVTRIQMDGDLEVYVPRQAQEIDTLLLALHKEMVNQAMENRLEIVKAIAEMIAGLFGSQKAS
jgi:cell division protein ZapA (FtsZ GTPase activity inhibitor)